MFFAFFSFVAAHMLWLALHLETGSFPRPLSKEAEAECFARLAAGDSTARDRLIRHNLRLVAHVVKKYYPGTADTDDLVSIGTIGLIKAVDSYRPEKRTRFSTYAARCIENEVLMFFRAGRKTAGTVFLSDPIDPDKGDGDLTVGDVLPDGMDVQQLCEDRSDARRLLTAMEECLDSREKQVIRLRYGFCGRDALTQQQTAGLLGISRSYVSRLEKRAVEKLRARLKG